MQAIALQHIPCRQPEPVPRPLRSRDGRAAGQGHGVDQQTGRRRILSPARPGDRLVQHQAESGVAAAAVGGDVDLMAAGAMGWGGEKGPTCLLTCSRAGPR